MGSATVEVHVQSCNRADNLANFGFLLFSSIAILKIACNHVPPRSATFDFSAIRFHQFFSSCF
jgi:hypothetical protein